MKKVSVEKKLACFSIVLFVLSITPILYLAGYVHATGDDYGYGALTHAAWLESHSLIEVLKASFKTLHKYYFSWQGTWFSIFLFTLQPEVFSPHTYWIVPVPVSYTHLTIYRIPIEKVGIIAFLVHAVPHRAVCDSGKRMVTP